MDSKEFDIKVRRLAATMSDSGFADDEIGEHLQSIADEYKNPN